MQILYYQKYKPFYNLSKIKLLNLSKILDDLYPKFNIFLYTEFHLMELAMQATSIKICTIKEYECYTTLFIPFLVMLQHPK